MKRILILVLALFGSIGLMAQLKDPVKWSFTAQKNPDNTYNVLLTARMQAGWHIYSQNGGDGPVSTTVSFTNNPLITKVGKVKEQGKLEKVFESAFNSNVSYYENEVSFVQTFKVKGNIKTNVTGELEYMVCNDRQCLPPKTVTFNIALN